MRFTRIKQGFPSRPGCRRADVPGWTMLGVCRALVTGISLCLILLAGVLNPANAVEKEQVRLAVLPFKARGASPVEAEAVTEEVRRIFVKSKKFVVVDRTLTDRILQEWEIQQTGVTEGERAIRIGKLYNVQTLVSGALHKFPDGGWQVSGVILNAETGETLSAESLRYRGDFFSLLDEKLPSLGKALSQPGGPPASTPAVAVAPQPGSVPVQRVRRKLAIFPPVIEGKYRGISLKYNNNILSRISLILEGDDELELVESYTLKDIPFDGSFKQSEYLEDKAWSGIFSKEPDLDFLFETGKSKGLDLILLYRVSIPECGGDYEVFLVDVSGLRKLERSGRWVCVKEGGLSWPRRVVMGFQELLEEYQR